MLKVLEYALLCALTPSLASADEMICRTTDTELSHPSRFLFMGEFAALTFNVGSDFQREVVLETCRGTGNSLRCYGYPEQVYWDQDDRLSAGESLLPEDSPELWIARPILNETIVAVAYGPFSHKGDTSIGIFKVNCSTLE